MILYHASTLCIVKPDVLHSRDKLDFGKGFYLTAFLEQAVRYAERFTQRGKDAFINEYELDDATPGFIVKSFPSYDEEWLDYVAVCRKGEKPQQAYDAVAGGVLDDSYKKFIKAIVIIYKGTGNSLDQTISIRRSEQVPQEELDYIREIWDSTQV